MSFIQKYLVNIIYAVKVLANVDARVKFDSVAEHGHQYLYKAMHSDISRAQVSPPPSAAPRPIASGPSRGHPRCMPPHSYRLSPRESPLVLVQFTPKSKKITRISVLGIVVLSFDVGVIPNGGRGGLLIAIPSLDHMSTGRVGSSSNSRNSASASCTSCISHRRAALRSISFRL